MTLQIEYENLTKESLVKVGILSDQLGVTFAKACALLLSELSKEELTQEAA